MIYFIGLVAVVLIWYLVRESILSRKVSREIKARINRDKNHRSAVGPNATYATVHRPKQGNKTYEKIQDRPVSNPVEEGNRRRSSDNDILSNVFLTTSVLDAASHGTLDAPSTQTGSFTGEGGSFGGAGASGSWDSSSSSSSSDYSSSSSFDSGSSGGFDSGSSGSFGSD